MGDSGQVAASAGSSGNGGAMALTAVGGLTSAYGQLQAGKYNKRVATTNAKLARIQADQAEQIGTFAANRVEARERAIEGSDAAAQAGGNTVVGAGTNRLVVASSQAASEMDQLMIELNARREAFGYRARAVADTAEGKMAERTGEMGAASTLLNTGSQEWLEADPNYSGFRGRGISFR